MTEDENLKVRRLLSNAKTLMRHGAEAAARGSEPLDYHRKAAGHVAAACKIMNLPRDDVVRRLRLPRAQVRALFRIGGGVGKRLREAGRAPLTCVRGMQCTCTSLDQRARCANWRRVDPAAFDIVGQPCQVSDLFGIIRVS